MSTKVLLLLTAAAVTVATAIYVLQPPPEPATLSNTAATASSGISTPNPVRSSAYSASDNTDNPPKQQSSQTTTVMAVSNNTALNDFCQQSNESAEARCTLRHDIDLSHAFAASSTELNGSKIAQALTSTNFEQLHQLLANANISQEALQRQADYQVLFNGFYQYAPGLLSNVVSCSDEICAASFTVADTNSAQQISSAMATFTQHINAHSFSTQGLDDADNLQVKLIFSNSAAFEAVVH